MNEELKKAVATAKSLDSGIMTEHYAKFLLRAIKRNTVNGSVRVDSITKEIKDLENMVGG